MKKLACCLLSFLITVLVVVGAVFGAGWYAYDRYAKDITGITYLEAWNVLSSLYGTKESKIITNSFDADAELAAVDGELKNLLFIDESVDFSIKGMIAELVGATKTTAPNGSEDGANGSEEQPPAVSYADAIIGINDEAAVSPLEKFADTLKFDFSELKDYDGAKHLLTLTDKQIGAVVNEAVLGAASKYTKGLAEQGVDIKQVFGVKEVKISSGEDALTANESTTISAVVKLNLRDAFEALMNTYQPKLKFLKGILPNAVYLTLEVKPFGEGLPSVVLNDNNEQENALVLKLLNGILNHSAGTKDADKVTEMFTSVDKAVKGAFKSLNEYLNIVFAPSELKANPLGFLVKQLGAENVTDTDLLYTISYLMHTLEGAENINWDAAKVDEFFADLKTKMPIDKSLELNLDNFVTELTKLGNHIDLDAMDYSKTSDEMRLVMNYDAVAGFVEKTLLTKENGGIMNMIKLRKIGMPDVPNAEADQLIGFVIEVAARDYIGIDGMENGLKKSLLDAMIHDIFIEATVSASGAENPAVGLNVNGLDSVKTKHMLTVLNKLLTAVSPDIAGDFSEEALMKKLQDGLTTALASIKGEGETAALELRFTPKGIAMQSVYEIIKTRKNITELTADEIRLTLKGVMETEGIKNGIIGEFDNNAATGVGYELDALNGEAKVSISDAYIAESVKETIAGITVTGGGRVELMQVLFADLSNEQSAAGSKLWNNATLRRIVEANGMARDKVLLVTTKVSLTNEIFKRDIYLSVVYDITTGSSALVVNDMDAAAVGKLAILIEKLSGMRVDFDKLAGDVIANILNARIRVNSVLEIRIADLIDGCAIENREAGLLGCGVLTRRIPLSIR